MFKNLTLFSLTAVTALILTACAKDDGGKDPVYNTVPACPAGQVWNGYNCAFTNTGNGYYGNQIGFYSTSNFQGQANTMNVSSAFKEYLRDGMGVCDRSHSNGGMANCNSWVGGASYLTIKATSTTSNQVIVSIGAQPRVNPYYNYSYRLPSLRELFLGIPFDTYQGIYANPLTQSMNIHPINNSQGFEIRNNGPTGSAAGLRLIRIIVPQGKLDDASVPYHVEYNGQQMMSGTLNRCTQINCGGY